jgi:deoxyadenosine/deoxycytidine kinase
MLAFRRAKEKLSVGQELRLAQKAGAVVNICPDDVHPEPWEKNMNGGVIIVEGNIGAGKSTFSAILAEKLGGEFMPEPAEGTNEYLEDYCKDPAHFAFKMQMFLLTMRYRAQKYAQAKVRAKGGFVVMDRSYYGDVCFANVQKDNGFFTERDYLTYMMHHHDMKLNLEPPAAAIFLNVSTEKSMERIAHRASVIAGRECESGYTLEYVEAIGREIDTLQKSMKKYTNVFSLDWNEDRIKPEIEQVCVEMAAMIRSLPCDVYDFWLGTDGI